MFKTKRKGRYLENSKLRKIEVFNNCKFRISREKRKKLPRMKFHKIKNISTDYRTSTKQNFLDKFKTQVKRFLVDTSISFIWSGIVMGSIEFFILGLSFEQTLKQRIAMCSFALFFGRTYGIFRDFFVKLVKTNEKSSGFRKYLTDSGACQLFYIPVYSAFLFLLNNFPLQKTLIVIGGMSIFNLINARIFTRVLDFWRKLWKTNPTLNK